MNILPHKSWHVRTKKNIARVRKDEAKAAEEEQKRQERIKLAEREARTELLRKRARGEISKTRDFIKFTDETDEDVVSKQPLEHVNFFKDLEDGTADLKKVNEEHEKDKKEEQEKYEKQIGYLTYLGQNTHEALGTKSWYNAAPERNDTDKGEVNLKSKNREDPLNIIKKYTEKTETKPVEPNKNIFPIVTNEQELNKEAQKNIISSRKRKRSCSKERKREHKSKHKKKKRKHKHKSKSETESEVDSDKEAKRIKLENLRKERLKREEDERRRSQEFIANLNGPKIVEKDEPTTGFCRQYNSQFNPELAKQNYVRKRRY